MEFGKLKLNSSHLVMLVAAAVLLWALYYYSGQKSLFKSGMANESVDVEGQQEPELQGSSDGYNLPSAADLPAGAQPAAGSYEGSCQNMGSQFGPANPVGGNSGPAHVSGMAGSHAAQPEQQNPAHLLPKDANSAWSKLNPSGNGDASNVNLLKAGYHIGRDTVLGTLRNANLQVRSEPANPQSTVGPWNNTTIGPDNNRRPLEIGCGPY